jgi:hypothetical protein
MVQRRIVSALIVLVVGGCGGGSNSTPTGPSGPQSTTVSGTASTNDTGGCSGPGHPLQTGAGDITVTAVQSNAARIKVQVCHPTAANHNTDCTVPPFASLAIGEGVTATLKGGSAQTVTVFPEACGAPGSPPASSINYTIRINYPGS